MTDTAALIAEINALPAVPSILADNMYAAQGFKLSAEDKVAVQTRKAFFAKMNMPTSLSLPVYDFSGAKIGHLTY